MFGVNIYNWDSVSILKTYILEMSIILGKMFFAKKKMIFCTC